MITPFLTLYLLSLWRSINTRSIHMLKRFQRKKVTPASQEYVTRRYEDAAIRIHSDQKRGRGQYNSYVPWIQSMLAQHIPDGKMKEERWLEQVSVGQLRKGTKDAWVEETLNNLARSKLREDEIKGTLESSRRSGSGYDDVVVTEPVQSPPMRTAGAPLEQEEALHTTEVMLGSLRSSNAHPVNDSHDQLKRPVDSQKSTPSRFCSIM